jgi:tetratricopeptide (TPR) repeat protein
MGRGYYYLQQNDAASALDEFNQARRFGADNYELYVGFGRTYYMLGRNRDAMLQLNEALRLANEERKVANRERRKGDVYVTLGLVYEATNPPRWKTPSSAGIMSSRWAAPRPRPGHLPSSTCRC